MHFSIPDTEELKDKNGTCFVVFNLHINGVLHCSVRFRQLYSLHQQLCKELGSSSLPCFPPKKLLSLNSAQIEERRISLEKYILQLSQDMRVLHNDIFNGWLVWAQNETQSILGAAEVLVDVYTMNGQKIAIKGSPTLQTNDLLQKVCKQLNLPDHLMEYFSLFLMRKDNKDIIIIKKLQDFESPYISQKCSRIHLKIIIRKFGWESGIDAALCADPAGLSVLYGQTAAEVECGWMVANPEVRNKLAHLQATGDKKQYIEMAQKLKYYGFIHFGRCLCDFPKPKTPVVIAAGDKELNFRIPCDDGSFKEGSFKVTRMRCWRISSLKDKVSDDVLLSDPSSSSLELSFEYLMSRDDMRWVRLTSQYAAFISLCLQRIVHALVKDSNVFEANRSGRGSNSVLYMRRDGTASRVFLGCRSDVDGTAPLGELSLRRLSQRQSEEEAEINQ